MIFIIFDIEIVFLYPWAVVFHQIATFGLDRGDRLRRRGLRVLPLPHLQRRPDLGPAEDPAVGHAEPDVGVDHHPDQRVATPRPGEAA